MSEQFSLHDIDWLLLGRYAGESCTPEERAEVEQRIQTDATWREALAVMRALPRQARGTAPNARADQIFASLEGTVGAARRSVPRLMTTLKIAAAVLLTLGASTLGYRAIQHVSADGNRADHPVRTIATARGQRLALGLGDGTRVQLAPASTLRIQNERSVELIGQAAFTVTHDTARPFTVRAGNLVARDLGTEFVIDAYPGEGAARVIVREGRVGIGNAVVTPGQKGYLSQLGDAVVEPADTAAAFAWTTGRLAFRARPIAEALAEIERWYNVDIQVVSPRPVSTGVTATFRPGDSPAHVLWVVASAAGFVVEQTGERNYALRGQ